MASRRHLFQSVAVAGAGLAAAPLLPALAAEAAAAKPSAMKDTPIRPPAVPLVVKSPYLSTWLAADNLPGAWPGFWTGRTTAMTGIALIDGAPFLFLGQPNSPLQYPLPTLRQLSLTTTATRSIFVLAQAGVELTVTFLSPVSPGDLKRQSQPLSYISVTARSTDGKSHQVSVYFDISGEWASGDAGKAITWESASTSGVRNLSLHRSEPQVLAEIGDAAEWGTVVLSSPERSGLTWQIGPDGDVRKQVATAGKLANTEDTRKPRPINDAYAVFAFCQDLGTVTSIASAPFVLSLGHVREPIVSYLGEQLPPLWKDYWSSWQAMVAAFLGDFSTVSARCARLDEKVQKDATKAGGKDYAALCALAFRQAYAATELASRNGKPWAFLKEISSNGNMQTIDVTYPSVPVWLYADPEYLALILAPILDYVENHKYPHLFAPHDLGTHYPNADGHLSGEGEEDMPVEESANMLIMAAAYMSKVSKAERTAYAKAHYPIFKQWGDYLVTTALDPDLQNQTDDFTGFIAHSVNLALKGIVGIGAMSLISTAAGHSADAKSYLATAKNYIGQWETKALDVSGKHLKLAYDQDGTWSLKYNGYADELLGLGLVPKHVAELEAAWYASRAATDGVPLDIRHSYTKADWEMWAAAWLKDHHETRDLLIEGLYTFANTTGVRVPLCDWYDTVANRPAGGFQARPVVGGLFALLTVQ